MDIYQNLVYFGKIIDLIMYSYVAAIIIISRAWPVVCIIPYM